MKTMVWAFCTLFLLGAMVLGEEKKEATSASIDVQRQVTEAADNTKPPSVHLVVSVKGDDVMSMRVVTTHKERPVALFVQTRGGGSCYYVLPEENVTSVSFKDWSLDLVRHGQDKRSYLDGNRWSWRLQGTEEPRLRRYLAVGTLEWKDGKWSFCDLEGTKKERLWKRTFFVLQD